MLWRITCKVVDGFSLLLRVPAKFDEDFVFFCHRDIDAALAGPSRFNFSFCAFIIPVSAFRYKLAWTPLSRVQLLLLSDLRIHVSTTLRQESTVKPAFSSRVLNSFFPAGGTGFLVCSSLLDTDSGRPTGLASESPLFRKTDGETSLLWSNLVVERLQQDCPMPSFCSSWRRTV